MPEIVRQVDHLLIAGPSGPELMHLFTGTLGLQTVWPWAVSAGNVTLELFPYDSVSLEHPLRAVSRDLSWPGEDPDGEPARVVGLALEPFALEAVLAEMDRRGVSYEPPSRQFDPADGQNLWWTTVGLPDISVGLWVFLVEFSSSTFEQWAARSAPDRGHDGGVLGVVGLSEIAVGVVDLEASGARWEAVFGAGAASSPGAWRPGGASTIRLVADKAAGILRLTFAVASLDEARRFLSAKEMLGADTGRELAILPSSVLGLDIRLVQS